MYVFDCRILGLHKIIEAYGDWLAHGVAVGVHGNILAPLALRQYRIIIVPRNGVFSG